MKAPTLWLIASLAAALAPLTRPALAADDAGTADEPESASALTSLSIEQFMNVEVTTAAKRPQKLLASPFAVYVITQEDIRRSGVVTIPELLRMVPGMDVAQITANKWAVSTRGFNSRFADKLLVLVDGRSVYSPLTSGVEWDTVDTLLHDVDRIEVICGPGGTLWGANAVNGIINIITKNARDTQGIFAAATTGNLENGGGAVRYGGKFADSGYLRVFAKGFDRNGFVDNAGNDTHDSWHQGRGGFRADWAPTQDDTLLLEGDFYKGASDLTRSTATLSPLASYQLDTTEAIIGGHALFRWHRRLSATSGLTVQSFYDRTDRGDATQGVTIDTYDLDVQHRFRWGEDHEVIWGFGVRDIEDSIRNTVFTQFIPASLSTQIFNVFGQDEIALGNDLHLTVGSKFEHSSATGFQYQPSARLLWEPAGNQAVWGAVSRAVHTPSRVVRNITANLSATPGAPPVLVVLQGNPDQKSDDLLALEAGYRNQLTHEFSVEFSAFYNIYTHHNSIEPGSPVFMATPAPPHLLITNRFGNFLSGEAIGTEISANWQVTDAWRLAASYSWLNVQMHVDPGGVTQFQDPALSQENYFEGSSPQHQGQIRSYLDLPWNLEFDGALYVVGPLPSQDVPAYERLDLRFGWRPTDNIEISLSGQNLTHARHPEFGGLDVVPSEVPRSVYLNLSAKF